MPTEVVWDCVSKHLYSSADKVAALTADPADIYMQAQALFLGCHYRHAFHLLNASKIVLTDLQFRYLAAKCLLFQRELLNGIFVVSVGKLEKGTEKVMKLDAK
ncbi:hypothetical protein JHK82_055330 [Glycine max]|nr:hypothetical protein JHK86_055170 [Glycine max]KAG4917865.1 hypothetical protein JHK85_056146 [Glycine max]KAG5073960.1 hypothetical protein JHK84_055191 [Glycine max]KAG5076635.1 hypothetical protein JHK82_055330 [Glycine max]